MLATSAHINTTTALSQQLKLTRKGLLPPKMRAAVDVTDDAEAEEEAAAKAAAAAPKPKAKIEIVRNS